MFIHLTIVIINITVIHITIINKILAFHRQQFVRRFEKGKGKGIVGDEQVLIIILFTIILLLS